MFWVWVCFVFFVMSMLALDLGVLNRKAHEIGVKEAFMWTVFWVALAIGFDVLIYFMYEHHLFGMGREIGRVMNGRQASLMFFTGYLIEESLSLDNIFVIALVFEYFQVPRIYQHRTLFWGVVGAQILRGLMIGAGVILIRRLEWMIFVFGVLLILTAIKLLLQDEKEIDPDRNPLVRIARRIYPVSRGYEGERFFTRMDGRRAITPLFLVLLVVESMDVLFAVDSIPAIFSVTLDPFIIFTSNVFAILGLRSLYFALAAIMGMFKYLKISLVFILGFVGVKMLLSHLVHIETSVSLGVIAGILAAGVIASMISTKRELSSKAPPHDAGME
jgi:tellurite resistance protein TerC